LPKLRRELFFQRASSSSSDSCNIESPLLTRGVAVGGAVVAQQHPATRITGRAVVIEQLVDLLLRRIRSPTIADDVDERGQRSAAGSTLRIAPPHRPSASSPIVAPNAASTKPITQAGIATFERQNGLEPP